MALPLYIYDPTATDALSKVRGIGRYLQILREALAESAHIQADVQSIPYDSVLLNPFFNILQRPTPIRRVSRYQVAVIHDLIPLKYPLHFPLGWKGTFNVLLNKWKLSQYEHIITDSEASKKDIVQLLSVEPARISVIRPTAPALFWDAVETTPSLPSSLKVAAQNYCIYVGDATWNKNLVNLAQAIKIADIPCVFVGSIFTKPPADHPWHREYHSFRSLAAGDPRFIFPGYIADEELIALYKNALTNILPSFDEGFGFSYLEASILGVPSVVSDIDIFHEIAADTAVFVDPEDPQSMAAAVTAINTDAPRRAAVASAARTRASQFAPALFRDALTSCFTSVATS